MYDLVPWGSSLGSCIGSAKSSLDHQASPLNTTVLVYKSPLLSLCFSGTKPPAHFFGQSHFVILFFCLFFSSASGAFLPPLSTEGNHHCSFFLSVESTKRASPHHIVTFERNSHVFCVLSDIDTHTYIKHSCFYYIDRHTCT